MNQSVRKLSIFLLFLIVQFGLRSQNLTVFRAEASLQETVATIENIVEELELIRFETVVHETIAENVGVNIDSTEVIFFEDPKLTTSLILCEQTTALELPLKIMVWKEDEDTYIGYMDPLMMKRRFLITDCDDTLAQMTKLMVRIVNDTLRKL